MQVESIKIKNYRLFRDAKLVDVPRLCVLVGANGTGKSTLFDVFSFLNDALAMNVSSALAKRGGYREVASRGFAHEPIELTLQFRLKISGKERLVTYLLKIAPSVNGLAFIEREVLRYERSGDGTPFLLLDFSNGTGYTVTNKEESSKQGEELVQEEQQLGAPDILAIKGLGQFKQFEAASALRLMIENWHVRDFHLSTRDDDRCQTEDGRLVLRFEDGTIKILDHVVLLNDPKPCSLLAIEHPENHLYPELIPELAEAFRDCAKRGGQVFISTHSPDFLNALTLDEIYCLRKQDGFTTISRATDSERLQVLFDQGDLPGNLWRQQLFEGLNKTPC